MSDWADKATQALMWKLFPAGFSFRDEAKEDVVNALRKARDDALEEAAQVADRMSREWATEWHRTLKCDEYIEGMSDGASDVAAAIRALKENQ